MAALEFGGDTYPKALFNFFVSSDDSIPMSVDISLLSKEGVDFFNEASLFLLGDELRKDPKIMFDLLQLQ